MKKIKSITVTVSTADTPEEGYKSYHELRDLQGNVLLEEQFYADGSLARRVERSYEGERLMTAKFYTQEGIPDQETMYRYAASGKPDQVRTVYAGGGIELKQISYDEANKGETIVIGDENAEVESKEYRRYDSEGKVLEEAIYEGESELTQKTETSFDDHARPVARRITYGDGFVLDLSYEYEMDDQGRVIGMKVTNHKGEEVYYEEFEYDEKNNIAEHYVENTERKQIVTKKMEYDDQNRIVREQTLNVEDLPEQEVHFQYDETGQLAVKETNTTSGFTIEQYQYEFFE